MDLLLAELAAIGYCQPDGTFITTFEELGQWLGEMARLRRGGVRGQARHPGTRSWVNQKVVRP